MPAVSEAQRRAMQAAAHGRSTLGIPKKVGEEFVAEDANNGIAAGTVFVAPDGDILLLRRGGKEENFAGHWALPGGKADEGETPEQAADRESVEEMGDLPEAGKPKLLDKRSTPNGMVFHTFARPTETKFGPKLNDEHSGYGWFGLHELPEPIHPSVRATLTDRLDLGAAADMEPDAWKDLHENFAGWARREEEAEPHRAYDEALRPVERLAFDRKRDDSARTYDEDGRLHVSKTHISKAAVNEYLGSEIPDYQSLGLQPDKLYKLYRDPEELAKAANTFRNLPLLSRHVPVDARDHRPDLVIGSLGTDVEFSHPYLDNSIVVWDGSAITDIEDEYKKELSSAYRYRADMTPGRSPDGEDFDGVMRDLVGNHVALVKQGRAGPDVVVGDSKENLMAKNVVKMTRKGQAVCAVLTSHARPFLAQDAAIDLRSILAKLTSKNFAASKPTIVKQLGEMARGKIAQDGIDGLIKLVDALEGDVPNGEDEADVPPMEPEEGSMDAGSGALAEFLKGKLSDEDIARACELAGSGANDEDDGDDEEAKKKREEEARIAAQDEVEEAVKESTKDMVTKDAMGKAMDEAIKAERTRAQGVRDAENEVRPYVGNIKIAQDSAVGVYQTALGMLGVDGAGDIKEVPALRAVLKAHTTTAKHEKKPAIAQDEAGDKSFSERFPGASRIKVG